MFVAEKYRAKAAEYAALAKVADAPDQVRALEKRERSLTTLADNEQWLAANHDKMLFGSARDVADATILAVDEERILRCLGAALIMRWNTVPQKLQRELFDDASSMGELSDTAALRGQIARFLHKHKNDEDEARAASHFLHDLPPDARGHLPRPEEKHEITE